MPNHERFLDLTDITTGSPWNGNHIQIKKECSGCQFLREIQQEKRCYWGVAWKKLHEVSNPRSCPNLKKPSPRLAALKREIAWEERIRFRGLTEPAQLKFPGF